MKDSIKKVFTNKKVTSIVFAILVFIALCLQQVIQTYNPISWIIFIVLIILYNKIDCYNKDFFRGSIVFSLFFALFLTFGKIVYANLYNSSVSVWDQFFSISNFISYIGVFVIVYTVLINILPILYNYKIKHSKRVISPKKVFIISFIVMILGWIPYFLSLYPGALSNDSIGEISIIMNNFTSMTNHHPMIHVLFITLPFKIGMSIFGNINAAVACSSVFQMICMSSIFSYFIYYLAKRKVNNLILSICLLYFAFVPMHGYYSVTMWKDIMFSGFVLLLVIQLINICDKKEKLRFKDLISFILISLFTVFFRNNAIYMFFILIVVMLVLMRKNYKVLLASFVIILSVYYSVTGPLFDYLKIARSSSTEYIGMPLQQIARMAYKDVKFTKDEKNLLSDLMTVENMKKNYIPTCSDGIKFSDDYNNIAFDENKGDYFKLWLQLIFKHPGVAVESYAVSTLGYWYPGIYYWTVHDTVVENKFGIYKDSKAPEIVSIYVDKIESRNVPILNMTWSTSLSFWIIAIFCYICIRKKKIKYLIPYIPIFGIWVTMMIASPVFGEFRYIYSSYTCLPLLMVLPYISNKTLLK